MIVVSGSKPNLRATLRQARASFVAALPDRPATEAAASTRLVKHLHQGAIVAAYIAVGDEIGTTDVLHAAAARGIATALPHITTRDRPMRFLRWTPGDPLEPGPMGLSQPAFDAAEISPDVIVTPLLGFDRGGGRIGQGAGYYDRAFAAHPHARRIGIGWSGQEVAAIPLDPWDITLHAIATEAEWIDVAGMR